MSRPASSVPAALDSLLARRTPPLLLGACFLSYAILLVWGIARHEPWFDEAQAWLLARDLGFWDLQARHLRYEGTPGLWHALLHALIRVGIPYSGMAVVGGLAAAAGAYLLLRFSPFPALVRCLLPFTFFVSYQYAVLARSYNLLAPFLFGAAILFPRRRERPLAFAALLVLLSNASLHGFLIASGIGAVILGEWLIRKPRARPTAAVLAACLLFLASGAWIAWQLWPPADLAFAPSFHVSWSRFAVAAGNSTHNALAESPLVSEAALAITLWWMWRRGTLWLFLAPAVLLISLAAFRHGNVWHEGAIWLVWIFALWIGFQREPSASLRDSLERRWIVAVAASILVVSAVQISWTVRSYAYDISRPYSGSRELARALASPALGRGRIHIDGYRPVAALAYLPRNVFANLNGGGPAAYWPWDLSNRLVRNGRTAVWDGDPDWAVLSAERARGEIPPSYVLVARFPGALFWKTRIFEADSYALYARRAGADVPAAGRSGGR